MSKVKFPHAIVIVTLTCNLKCKRCILCAPYYKKPFHPDLDYIKATTDKAFELGDYEIFEFNGGEPFLRKDLADIFDYALRYKDAADVFKTVTNGTLMPSDDLIAVWKKYEKKFYCIVDDYGPELSPNSNAVYELLKSAGIACEKRDMWSDSKHHGGWADFRAETEPRHSVKEAEAIYLKCAQAQKLKHCCNIIDGLLMPCHLQFQLNDRDICRPLPHEFIDLFDETETIEQKRKKMANFTNINVVKSLSACRWCPGLSEDAQRLKPAEQLTKDDYETAMSI